MLNVQVNATISVQEHPDDRVLGLAVDTFNRIYVLVSRTNAQPNTDPAGYVRIIDGATNVVTGQVINVGADPRLAAVDTGLGRLYVGNRVSSTVSVIDTATQQVATTLHVGSALFGVAVDPVLHRIYIASAGTGEIVVLDDAPGNPQRPQKIATIPVGDAARPLDTPQPMGAYPYYVAVNPKTHRVYAANFGGDWGHAVSVIDGLTNSLLTTVSLADATGTLRPAPHGIAVNPSTNRVYVGCLNLAKVVVIEDHPAQSPAIVAAITVPAACFAVRVDPGTNMVWASCGHEVVLIDGETHTQAASIKVSAKPQDLVVDPGSHRVYAADQSQGIVSVLELVD